MPHSTRFGCRPDPSSTTPYPRIAVPGSMPSTLTRVPSGFSLGQLCRVDVEVGEDLGDVVQFLEHIHEPDDALCVGALDPHGIARDHGQFGRLNGKSARPECIL